MSRYKRLPSNVAKGSLRLAVGVNFQMRIKGIYAKEPAGRFFGPGEELDLPEKDFKNQVRGIVVQCDFAPRKKTQRELSRRLMDVLEVELLDTVFSFVKKFAEKEQEKIGSFSVDRIRSGLIWFLDNPMTKVVWDSDNIKSICVGIQNGVILTNLE